MSYDGLLIYYKIWWHDIIGINICAAMAREFAEMTHLMMLSIQYT